MARDGWRLVVTTLLAGIAATAQAEWAAYTSTNFTLFSDAPESEVLGLLGDFEEYRRVALAVMALRDEPENQALKIVYPTRADDFRALGANDNVAGFFYHAEFGPRIAIRGARSRRGMRPDDAALADRRTLYHEYVHYLMDQKSGRNYPPWYSEGLASVLMMVDPAESIIEVGLPLPNVNWRSVSTTVEDIVGTDYRGGIGDFYLMSWLLTHYLTIDSADKPERQRQFADYLRRYDAGENPVEAFAASFGQPISAMQRAMGDYRGQRRLKVLQVPRSTYDGEISRRAMQPGEELYLLGDLAVELYASKSALELFDGFDEQFRDSPLRFKVDSRRAVALVHEDDLASGDAVVGEILARDVNDADIMADLAHYYHDRFQIQAREDDVPVSEARASLAESIRYGELAVAHNPGDLEALFYLGRAYGFSGDHEAAARTLLRAFQQAPGVPDINSDLARALYHLGNVKDAALLIARNLSASHSEAARQRYSELLAQINEGNPNPEFLDPYPRVSAAAE